MSPRPLTLAAALACQLAVLSWPARAKEDIAFVTEHLAEAAMDNRVASLPVWPDDSGNGAWQGAMQAAYARTTVGGLTLDGPMLSVSFTRALSAQWSVGALGFFDALSFSGDSDHRPLDPLFSRNIPLELPADAAFSGLDGTARDTGIGVFVTHQSAGWLGEHHWVGGVMWQKESLRDYRLAYAVLSGADSGATGSIDFSADYTHVTPYAGLEIVHRIGRWSLSPHVLAAVPIPKRSVKGCITGTGFDICGDTASAGQGKHFGNPYVALGMGLGYEPWRVTLDVGSIVTQPFIEPAVHKGIDRNWLLSLDWRF
jgi:hypothetical protein